MFLGWRTKDQLMKLHNGNKDLVETIIEKKITMQEYKDHPDAPENEEAILYYVLLDISMTNEEETEERTDIAADINLSLGSEAGKFWYFLHACCMLFYRASSVFLKALHDMKFTCAKSMHNYFILFR